MNNLIVSIDGPAGSGKERIAKYIAKKYHLYHLDSGILYRRIALILIKNNIQINDEKKIKKFLLSLDSISPRKHLVLRKQNVSKASSQIAVLLSIRKFINLQQQKIVAQKLKKFKGCVIDARDIGSKVFKGAKIKLFIKVNVNIRAKRRHKQLIALGEKSIYAQILKEIKLRDKLDKNRKHSPLIVPKSAIILDNSKSFQITSKQINLIFKKLY